MNLKKHWAALLEDYVIDMDWSPDGGMLAAASSGGAISVFCAGGGGDAGAGVKLHELPGHEDGTNCVAWAPGEGSLLASGGQDGMVKLWDAATGRQTAAAKLGGAWVEHIAWRPAGPAAAGGGGGGGGDGGGGGVAREAREAREALLAAAAGREVVFLGADGVARHRCEPAAKTVQAIAWEPTGGALAAAHFGGARLWDGDDFFLQKEYPCGSGVEALLFSPDGRWLVAGNQDRSVHLWIPETGAELRMSGYEGKVTALAFDSRSQWLATGGGEAVSVWNCSGPGGPEGREPDQLPHPANVCALAFQRARGLLASASVDGSVMLWSLDGNRPLQATIKMPAAATRLAWSPDDRFLAIGSEKGAVYVLAV